MTMDEEVQLALESVMIERRKMEAMLIELQADVETGSLMKEISLLVNNTASFQIRYLNTVENIISNQNENVLMLNSNLKSLST